MRRIVYFFSVIIFLSSNVILSQDYQRIKSIIADVNADSLIENLNLLTGVKPVTLDGKSVTISSRYRGTAGNTDAALFLKNKLSRFKSLKVSEQLFPESGKNILAVQTGSTNPKRQIIVCSHFDSMPNGPLSPGADDNGTGTIAVLEAARILSKYSTSSTIVYAMFDQEEDNLNGSDYYASLASKNNDTIIAVINLDMIGWDKNNSSDVEIDTRPISTSVQLANNIKDVNDKCNIGLYVTIINPGSPDADQASFWKYKFPAILLIELYGNLNPYYHKPTDMVQNINKPFYEKCTKLGIASVARYTDLSVIDGVSAVKELPVAFNSLEQNYPNPFNPATVINYKLSMAGNVSLIVFDILGREVATLVNEFKQPGKHSAEFKLMSNQFGSGMYFYRLNAGSYTETKKMLLMK